jgi:hypothetical protein
MDIVDRPISPSFFGDDVGGGDESRWLGGTVEHEMAAPGDGLWRGGGMRTCGCWAPAQSRAAGRGHPPSIETLAGVSSRAGRTSASSSLSACARRGLRWFTKLLTGGRAACAAYLVLELLVFAVVLVHAVFFVGPPSFVESQAHALRAASISSWPLGALRRRSAWPHHH